MEDNKKETKKPSKVFYDEFDENDIDGVLKKELEEQDLECRFIDFKQARANGGASRNGWRVYKRKSDDPRIQGIAALADPDGLVRKGSLVLAVKHKELAQRQRDRIQKRNDVLKRYTKNARDEISDKVRKIGGSSRVIAGYDNNN